MKPGTRIAPILLIGTITLAPGTTMAALGSCEFKMHSGYLKQSFLVCQSADSAADCGHLKKSPATRSSPMGYAEGKEQGKINFRPAACDASRALGVCLLPGSELFFYEGAARQLASGCARMGGEWKDFLSDKGARTLFDRRPPTR